MSHKKDGMAMVMVLMLSVVLVTLVGAMFLRTGQQKVVTPRIYEETKALFLAKGFTQLALYKVKVLPADFYRAGNLLKRGSNEFMQEWLKDFDCGTSGTLAYRMLQALPDKGNFTFQTGIATCSFWSQDSGFKKDLLKMQVWGKCNDKLQNWESLVEMDIKVDTF